MNDRSAVATEFLTRPILEASQMRERPSPLPAAPGVYGWWFDHVPPGVPIEGCERRGPWTLLYVGISPKRPPTNGKRPSSQNIRSRIRYHCRGNAAGSTLRLTLGVLLSSVLDIELRRVGSGSRYTFSVGEQRLTDWIAAHGRVGFVTHPEPWLFEEELIASLSLPLNLDQNGHPFRPTLSALRGAARASAAALPVLPR